MDTSSTPQEKKGLKKLWFKVRASMKSGSTSANTTSVTSPTTPKAAIAATPQTPAQKPIADMAPKAPENKSQNAAKEEAQRRFERAQAIFKKYDMELDPADWEMPTKGNVERVHKQPRMRVRWTCHECKASFGRDMTCNTCSHERCKQCIRYPPKKTKKTMPKNEAPPATMPTSGPCHECRTEFPIGASECSNCKHQICDQCLKETVVESPATAPPAQPISVAAA